MSPGKKTEIYHLPDVACKPIGRNLEMSFEDERRKFGMKSCFTPVDVQIPSSESILPLSTTEGFNAMKKCCVICKLRFENNDEFMAHLKVHVRTGNNHARINECVNRDSFPEINKLLQRPMLRVKKPTVCTSAIELQRQHGLKIERQLLRPSDDMKIEQEDNSKRRKIECSPYEAPSLNFLSRYEAAKIEVNVPKYPNPQQWEEKVLEIPQTLNKSQSVATLNKPKTMLIRPIPIKPVTNAVPPLQVPIPEISCNPIPLPASIFNTPFGLPAPPFCCFFKCFACRKTIQDPTHYLLHKKNECKLNVTIKCPGCEKIFLDPYSLRTHMVTENHFPASNVPPVETL